MMSSNFASIDITNNPDLLRLAEEVAATKTPRKLTRDHKEALIAHVYRAREEGSRPVTRP